MRQQVTREDYFHAALDILATEGHHALKMTPLCRKIGVTTGSFYNHFGNWPDFVRALLTYWESDRMVRLRQLSEESAEPLDQLLLMKELASRVTHDAEAAIRSWSNGDPVVAEFQRRVDVQRLEALRTVIGRLAVDPRTADLLSVVGMSMLAGMQQLGSSIDIGAIMVGTADQVMQDLLDEFLVHILTAAPTDGNEPRRVSARHTTHPEPPRRWFTDRFERKAV